MGLITRIAPDHVAAALELAETIAQHPQDTMNSDREALLHGEGLQLPDGLALEARLGRARLSTAHAGAQHFSERPR